MKLVGISPDELTVNFLKMKLGIYKVKSVMIFKDKSSSNFFRLNVWEILQMKFVEISPDKLNSNFSI